MQQLPQLAISCIIVSVVFWLLSLVAIALRFLARRRTDAKLGWNDWTIVFALICGAGVATTAIFSAANGGVGAPAGQLDKNTQIQLFQTLIASLPTRTAALAFTKTSILLLYKHIFVTSIFQNTANVFLVIVWAWALTYIIGFLCVSTPLSLFWTSFHEVTNYSLPTFTLSCSCIDLVLDVLILCLPIPAVWNLQMQRRQKYQIISIFWLGIFCVIASVCCIYYVYAESKVTNFKDPEYYWLVAQSAIWGNIEVGVSIVAACLPTYGPLVNGWRFSTAQTRSASTKTSSNPTSHPRPAGNTAQNTWKRASLLLGIGGQNSTTNSQSEGSRSGWVSIPGSGATDSRLEREIAELDRLEEGEGRRNGRGTPDAIFVERTFRVESLRQSREGRRNNAF